MVKRIQKSSKIEEKRFLNNHTSGNTDCANPRCTSTIMKVIGKSFMHYD